MFCRSSIAKVSNLLFFKRLHKPAIIFPPKTLHSQHFQAFCSHKSTQAFHPTIKVSLLKDDPALKVSDYEKMLNDLRHSVRDQATISHEDTSNLLRLFYRLAIISQKERDMEKSLKYYAEALAFIEKAHDKDLVEMGVIYNSLGSVYLRQEDFSEAEKYLNKANDILEKHKESHEGKTQYVENLYMRGMLQERKGQNQKALDLYNKALALTNELPQEDAARALVVIYDNLGLIDQKEGNLRKAIESWKKGMESCITNYGKDSMQAKIFFENLAWANSDLGNFADAVKNAEKALAASTKHYGAENANVSSNLFLLGEMNVNGGQYDKALEYFNQGVKLLEKAPQEHPDQLAHAYMMIAKIYCSQNQQKKASEYFQKAIKAIGEGTSLEQDLRLADYYGSWASLIKDNILTVPEAKKCFQKALDILQKSGSKEHPKFLDIYFNLGEIAYYDDLFDEALTNFQKCLALPLEGLEGWGPYEDLHSFLGQIYLQKKDYKKSIEAYEKAIKTCKQRSNAYLNLDFHYRNLALAHEQSGNLETARGIYQEALNFTTEKYGKDDETTQRDLELVVGILQKQNKQKEIEELKKKYQ